MFRRVCSPVTAVPDGIVENVEDFTLQLLVVVGVPESIIFQPNTTTLEIIDRDG